ncbi:MAG TPA: radical SAM protein [Planctomycetota bacterium]|nr:radical SAM protein [Planctomycetota bacterium]
MPRQLDLLLLTDEVYNAEFNRYNQFDDWQRSVFRALEFDARDAELVHRRFGVEHYLVESNVLRPDGRRERLWIPIFPHRPSLALCDLATLARHAGQRVAIVDNVLRYAFRRAQALELLRDSAPRLVGISTTFILSPAKVRAFVELVRQASPASKIVLGGPTVRRDKSLHGVADFAVFGSGEQPLLEILELLDGKRTHASLSHCAFVDEEKRVRYADAASEETLVVGRAYRARAGETIPVPDWSIYPRSRANVHPIEFSRGCKYNCFYCSYDRGKNIRTQADIRAELIQNAAHGITKYRLGDSNFTDGPPSAPRYPHDVCKTMIELDLDLEWSCYARADDLTPELADTLKRAGCFAVFLGLESGDDALLLQMRKGHDSKAALAGVEIAKRAGLFVHANFVVGYPGETESSYRKTLDLIVASQPDTVTLGQFFVEDNAPVKSRAMAAAHGLEGSETRWSHSTMDSAQADELIARGHAELTDAGITLGNEFEIAAHMSAGMSFEENRRFFAWKRDLLDPSAPAGVREAAKLELREIFLTRLPEAVGRDQQCMRSAT